MATAGPSQRLAAAVPFGDQHPWRLALLAFCAFRHRIVHYANCGVSGTNGRQLRVRSFRSGLWFEPVSSALAASGSTCWCACVCRGKRKVLEPAQLPVCRALLKIHFGRQWISPRCVASVAVVSSARAHAPFCSCAVPRWYAARTPFLLNVCLNLIRSDSFRRLHRAVPVQEHLCHSAARGTDARPERALALR